MRATDPRSTPARVEQGRLAWLERAGGETAARAALFIVLGVLAGIAGALSPLTLLAGVVVLGAAWLLAWRDRPRRVFHGALLGLLVGYAFMGRGLAHVGVPPLYVGELVLGLGLVSALVSIRELRLGPIGFLLIAYMAWGAARTIPYLGEYGIDSLRDGVSWGYALFALIVSQSIGGQHFWRITDVYRTVIPVYCLWIPMTLVFGRTSGGAGSSDGSLINPKAGDVGVLLAGIAAFILLGLYSWPRSRPRVPEWIMWLIWLPAAALVAIFNRGGTAAMAAAAAVIFFVRLPRRWLPPIFFTLITAVLLVWVNPKVDFGSGRSISVTQVVENVTSIVTSGDNAALEGTKEFRLRWWGEIVDYTLFGPYFWTGKGFGVNLADDDGFQITADHSLRAPHNGHLEILARAGVPGALLWLLLNAAIGISLLQAAGRARALGRAYWVAVDGWLFVAWAASLVNASFDPYLQGPQGGIWFWVTVGLAIVAVEASTRYDPQTPPRSTGQTADGPPGRPAIHEHPVS